MGRFENIDGGLSGPRRQNWLIYLICRLDLFLRIRQDIFEYSNLSDCIFRMQLVESANDLILADGTYVRVGDRIIHLHLWNEHVPLIEKGGLTWAFARRVDHCIDASLAELERYIGERTDLDDIGAVRGNLVFETEQRRGHMARIAARYGFEFIPSSRCSCLREIPEPCARTSCGGTARPPISPVASWSSAIESRAL